MTEFQTPEPELQITFFHRLQEIRKTYLIEALLLVVEKLQISKIDAELKKYASNSYLQKLAGWGLRGEILFPVPYILKQSPQLLGYYRLLLGFSQKQFYGKQFGFGRFKAMEERGNLTERNENDLATLCKALCHGSKKLLDGVKEISMENVHELTLLTLGPQLKGGALIILGAEATRQVFNLIHKIVKSSVMKSGKKHMKIQNAAGRIVRIEFSADPDICVREELPSGNFRNLVAIEIKGGRDVSNIHNRIGEAEKSYQKARKDGFVECWTMVGVAELNMNIASSESPTTDRFNHIYKLLDSHSGDFVDFKENLMSRVGVKQSRGGE